MASAIAERWTFIDRLFQGLRYKKTANLIPHGCVLADLGCGNGDFLCYVREKVIVAYGIDTIIKGAGAKKDFIFKEGDLNKRIPLDNESVDVITALAVLEHLHNPEGFSNEILRILKPMGYCILTTPTPKAKPILEILAYKLKIISEKDIRDHKHYFSENEIRRLFSKFSDVGVEYFQFKFNMLIIAKK